MLEGDVTALDVVGSDAGAFVIVGTRAALYVAPAVLTDASSLPPFPASSSGVGVVGAYPQDAPLRIYWSEPTVGADAIYECDLPTCIPKRFAHGPGTIVQIDVTANGLYWVTERALLIAGR